MLRDRARLTVGVPIHPKGVGWEWGQGLCVDQSGFHYLVHRGIFMLKQETVFSKVLPKSYRHTLYLNIPLYHFFPPAWSTKSPCPKVYVVHWRFRRIICCFRQLGHAERELEPLSQEFHIVITWKYDRSPVLNWLFNFFVGEVDRFWNAVIMNALPCVCVCVW